MAGTDAKLSGNRELAEVSDREPRGSSPGHALFEQLKNITPSFVQTELGF